MIDIIKPDWKAPKNIRAFTTTRHGGYSEEPFDSLNMGGNVGDSAENIQTNRALLKEALDIPSEPVWLQQIHSATVVCADIPVTKPADGSFARLSNKVCVVLTADCLPILITNSKGNVVAALHAGWRSLAGGIIEECMKIISRYSNDFIVWLGPAISQKAFEVGPEVREAFMNFDKNAKDAFIPSKNADKWMADLYRIARQRFAKLGITNVSGGEYCTYTNSDLFYSYRRDGQQTGRMATMIWMS